MAVLGEDEGEVGGFEMVAEVEDVGEGGGGHVEEDVLHVDHEQDGSHCVQGGRVNSKLDESRRMRQVEIVVAEFNGMGPAGIVA